MTCIKKLKNNFVEKINSHLKIQREVKMEIASSMFKDLESFEKTANLEHRLKKLWVVSHKNGASFNTPGDSLIKQAEHFELEFGELKKVSKPLRAVNAFFVEEVNDIFERNDD